MKRCNTFLIPFALSCLCSVGLLAGEEPAIPAGNPASWSAETPESLAKKGMTKSGNGEEGEDGAFSGLFGSDFNVTGGTLRYVPEKKAIIIRDYATIVMQGRRLRARNIIYFTDIGRVYAEGDVSLEDKSGSFLNCEQLYFDTADWKGRAKNIRLRKTDEAINSLASVEETDVTLTAPTIDPVQKSPLSDMGEYEREDRIRMNVSSPDLRLISKDHYEATDVWASPSNYAEPHWRISSQAVHVRPDEKVEAYNNLFKIGKVPVFYVPYLIYDLRYNWPYYRTSVGSDKRMGWYALTRLGWQFDNPVDDEGVALDENGQRIKRYFQIDDIFGDVDFRSKRGWGLGLESDYQVDLLGKGKGNIRSYWTNEIYTTGTEDSQRAEQDVEFRGNDWNWNPGYTPAYYGNQNRWLVQWWHAHDLPGKFDLRAQVQAFSDRDFYKEYFRDYWEEDQEKLTSVNLRYLDDLFESELLTQMRLNDYRTEVEYLPEWQLNLPGVRLGKLPLFVESQTNAGLMRKLSDSMLRKLSLVEPTDRTNSSGNTPWVGRVGNETKLSLPIDLKVLSVTPWAGGFVQGYSTSYGGNYNESSSKLNAAGMWGMDVSSRFFGYFGENKWMHMIEPTIGLLNYEEPAVNRNELYNIDEIDNYRKSRMITFNLYQALYKDEGEKGSRKYLEGSIKTGVILDNIEARDYNNGQNLADIICNAAYYPVDSLSIWGNLIYTPAGNKIDSVTGGVDFWFSKRLRMYLTHSYDSGFNQENPGNSANESNITTLAFRTQLWDKFSHYSLEYGLSYQWDSNASGVMTDYGYVGGIEQGIQKQRISLIRDLDTFEASVNYTYDHVNGDWACFVNLTPKGWVGVRRSPDDNYVTLDQTVNRYSHPVPDRMVADDKTYDTRTPAWQ